MAGKKNKLPSMRGYHFASWVMIIAIQLIATIGYAQQAAKLTIREQHKTVKEILDIIEKKANIFFFYKDADIDLDRKISVQLTDQPLARILEEVFKNTPNTFTIEGTQVYISGRSATPGRQEPPEKKDKISGIITGEDGIPIIGATVVAEGTSKGTTTDVNGSFSLEAAPGARLRVSYIGYNVGYINVAGKNAYRLALTPNNRKLDEVVVVAYGAQKKESVTGAISSINTKDLKKSSSANLVNALAGRISGLSIVQSSGQPGRDNAAIYLRGAATTNSTTPLILIDGVPRDNLSVLNPDEIESISVLKDASATAVFGVRGANGVILVTTKRGEAGKMQLSLNAETSLQSFTRKPKPLSSWDYMRLKNEAAANDHQPLIYSDETIAKYTNPNKSALEQYMYPNHFYYGELMRTFAPQTRTSLNMSGGTDKMKYFINGAYTHQGGQFKTESGLGYNPQPRLDRYSFRANVDYKLVAGLKAFLNIGSYLEKVAMPGTTDYNGDEDAMMTDIFRSLQYERPFEMGPVTIDVPDSNVPAGEVIKFDNLNRTGFQMVNRSGYRNDTRMNFNGSYGMDWDLSFLTKGFSAKGMISFDNVSATVLDARVGPQQYSARIVNVGGKEIPEFTTNLGKGTMTMTKAANYRYNVNMQASLNYARNFNGSHDVGGLVLFQRDYWESTAPDIPYNVIGFAGRVTYAYKQRYFAELNVGYNGSEQFAPRNRFGFFPAASLGWMISNEDFFKPLLPTVSRLKLRGSFGKVGNDKISSSRFLYIDEMYYLDKNANGAYGEFFLNSLSNGHYIQEGLMGNKDLTWEVATKQNYGVEIQLFRSLDLSFDYFFENRDHILITRSMVPALQGVDLGNIPKANMGRVNNKGFEIEAGYNKRITPDLQLSLRGNFSFNKNKVLFIDEPRLGDGYVYHYRQTGFPLGTIFGYEIDYSNGNGYFNSQDEINKYVDKKGNRITYNFGNYGLGDFKYVDKNGDGVIDEKDKVPLGNTMIPEISYGVTFGASYKGVDLSVFFQGLGKTSMCYSNEGVYEILYSGNYFDYHRNAWTPERYASNARITYPALHLSASPNHNVNSFFVMDRSFVRLKNAEIGYTLPARLLGRMKINSARIYISGQNLITWDKLRMNTLDPEVYSASSNLSGIVYPITKMYNLGINLTF